MEIVLYILAVLSIISIAFVVVLNRKRNIRNIKPLPPGYEKILDSNVSFYQRLNESGKKEFINRLQIFLNHVRITGVKTEVEDLDKLLVASSAIIPIFGFPEWEYMNLNEVLLYPDTFGDGFAHEGEGRRTLGLVGDGPYQNIMILSKRALRDGFAEQTKNHNTAIHEFVHLLDKTDGAVDGIPEFLLDRQYTLPWLELMRSSIIQIQENNSDINPYGATNQAEFFAVVSEYFFENPSQLRLNHPDLYKLLSKIFRQSHL